MITNKQLEEYIKCKDSFEYFCNTYIYVGNYKCNQIKLSPSTKQIQLINFIDQEKYVIFRKERQEGFSILMIIYCLWLTIFFDDITIGVISVNNRTATSFVTTSNYIIKHLPSWLSPKIEKYNKHCYVLENGSMVLSTTITEHSPDKTFIGRVINFLVIDEAAFIKNIESFWTSMVPCMYSVHKISKEKGIPYGCVISSSSNEMNVIGKWFQNKYNSASENNFGFFKQFIDGELK